MLAAEHLICILDVQGRLSVSQSDRVSGEGGRNGHDDRLVLWCAKAGRACGQNDGRMESISRCPVVFSGDTRVLFYEQKQYLKL